MIPQQIAPEFKKLCDKVSELHADWKKYRFLFGDNPQFFDVYNEIDASIFLKIQDLFHERICMSLCRLRDPAEQGKGKNKYSNLTLERLSNLAVKEDSKFSIRLSTKLKNFREKTKKFRVLRDKHFSHYDMLREMGADKELFSRRDVEDALAVLRDFMNEFRACFGENQMLYEEVVTQSDGGGFLRALQESIRYNELIEKGVIAEDDLPS